jgi:hypothetical protein
MSTVDELSERMKVAMESIRSGETNGVLENNADMGTKGRMNVYKDPPDRAPGTLDARWGDDPIPTTTLNYRGTYGTGTEREARDDRQGVLERIFSGMGPARDVARREIAQIFTGPYESRSTLLDKEKTAAAVHVPEEHTLTERVRSLTGER